MADEIQHLDGTILKRLANGSLAMSSYLEEGESIAGPDDEPVQEAPKTKTSRGRATKASDSE